MIADQILVLDDDAYRLTRDHLFTSPSTTALVLLGTKVNGGTAWKDAAGKTPEVWGRRWAARSGLKMGVWSPVDVVAPWSVEAVLKSGAGSCAVGPSLLS